MLAGIALIGVPSRQLALFPVIQAGLTACIGLILSFAIFLVAGQGAEALFGQGLPGAAPLVLLQPGQALAIAVAVLVLVVVAAGAAAWSALRLDPASVLREAA